MNEMSMTMTTPHAGEKKCRCGGKCKGECCELECLIQPRFFCGQLLTDQDLSALLDWVKGKSALSRYRHGWGVVCGLDVRCHGEQHSDSSVTVTPGYAIDCCGNDIVVCRDATIDLAKYCRPDANPCGDWEPRQDQSQANEGQTVRYGAWGVPKSEIVSVELRIRYAESLSDAKSGLARGGCDSTAICEYTRTIEGHELYAVPVDGCEDLTTDRAEKWRLEYTEELRTILSTLTSLYAVGEPERTVRRLLAWLDTHPLHHFCFVREWLCEVERSNNRSETWFRDVVFWIVQDWRNHYFQCHCFGCGPETGLPLARIWLWRRRDRFGKTHCTVLYVNAHPPFRRPLSLECWPTPAGAISLAPFIWQRPEDVCVRLAAFGLGDLELQQLTFDDVVELQRQLFAERVFVHCGEFSYQNRLVAYYVEDYCGHKRIVTFGDTKRNYQAFVAAPPPAAQTFNLEEVNGIGPGFAKRLEEKGINDLRDLVKATPEQVHEALRTPDIEHCRRLIEEAKRLLEKKGV